MTAPQHPNPVGHSPEATQPRPQLLRWAIWAAIGALIAAAVVCVFWVLVGPENDVVGRAFLTILLLAAFAGVAILDTHLAQRRPPWFALTSMVTWVVTMLLGALLIWMPDDSYGYVSAGFTRFVAFLTIVLVLQLALLHVRLYTKALARHSTSFTRAIGVITIALVAALALLLVIPLTFHEFVYFADFYWRVVVAITILAAVGTALVPLVNALFAPKRPRPAPPAQAYPTAHGYAGHPGYPPHTPQLTAAPQPWPTFVDGMTPLPVMPDGSPDWNAYYTGYPSVPQAPGIAGTAAAPVSHSPAAAPHPSAPPEPIGYQGYPPPPPAPAPPQ